MKKITILFLFVSLFAQSQNKGKVDLSNPNAALYTHIHYLMPEHYDIAKSAATVRGLPKGEAQFVAKRIKEILDGNGYIINFSKVPTNANYIDTIHFVKRTLKHNANRYAPFPVRLPEIYIEKYGENWYFSEETVQNLDIVYKNTFPIDFSWLNEKFPKFFEITVDDILIWKPIAAITTIIMCIILFYLLEPILFLFLKLFQRLFFKKVSNERTMAILHELAKPIVFIVIIQYIGKVLPALQMIKLNALLLTGLKIAETVFWIFVMLKLMKVGLNFYHEHKAEQRTKLDRQLEPILNQLLQGTIVLIGFLHILTLFGVNATTVLAGASIGGLAVAFAAQDSVKNLIGTMVIFLDKPFQLDDWVKFGDVEGSVERVGFRSTKIRGADTTLFQVPNSKISEADINNIGLMVFRRYSTEVGVRYDTPPELMDAFIEGIKKLIALHPSSKSQSCNVNFIAFGSSSLNIMINVYFKGLDWGQEQESKHILHMGIVRLAAALGVHFAFPSTTMMIEQFPGQDSLAPQYMTDIAEIEKQVKMIADDFDEQN